MPKKPLSTDPTWKKLQRLHSVQKIADLVYRNLYGSLSSEESNELEVYMSESAANRDFVMNRCTKEWVYENMRWRLEKADEDLGREIKEEEEESYMPIPEELLYLYRDNL